MQRTVLAVLAVCVVFAAGLPASGHTGHTSINFTCADPSPSTAGAHATWSCSWEFSDFDATGWRIDFPVDTRLNEDGSHDGADPSDGEEIGSLTIVGDLSYDGCGDANDGGTYGTYWEDTWTSFTPPSGWTKVAQQTTVLTVLFIFTEHVPSHVIKNDTTGQYALVTEWPADRHCSGTGLTVNPWTLYGQAQNQAGQEWVIVNPSAAGTYTVCITAYEPGGASHQDCDTITIT